MANQNMPSGHASFSPTMATLLVIYTERLDECRDFYARIGLPVVREQHGAGPPHYSAELAGGLVMELYPSRPQRATGRLRLGFTVADGDLPHGDHIFEDPDGRTVIVTRAADPVDSSSNPGQLEPRRG